MRSEGLLLASPKPDTQDDWRYFRIWEDPRERGRYQLSVGYVLHTGEGSQPSDFYNFTEERLRAVSSSPSQCSYTYCDACASAPPPPPSAPDADWNWGFPFPPKLASPSTQADPLASCTGCVRYVRK